MALECLPGRYPAPRELDGLAQYFTWSGTVKERADAVLAEIFGDANAKYVAVQWRNEFAEMSRPCGGFSAVQCEVLLDAQRAKEPDFNSQRMCSPGTDQMREMLLAAMKTAGTSNLFLASDVTLGKMKGGLGDMFAEFGAKIQPGGLGRGGLFRPQVDLAVLSGATLMIGHCPSSFTNVATRLRASQNAPTGFWGFLDSVK